MHTTGADTALVQSLFESKINILLELCKNVFFGELLWPMGGYVFILECDADACCLLYSEKVSQS